MLATAAFDRLAQFAPEAHNFPVGTLPRQTVDLPCGRVSYLRHGKGKPLLLVHGIPTSARLWEPLLGTLGERYDCIVPDLLGLGRSTPTPTADLSSPGQAEMLNQLLDALGLDEVYAVFHDQGGAHGMQYLKRYGHRIKAVIFTNCVCYDNWFVPVIALTDWLGRKGLIPILSRTKVLQTALNLMVWPKTVLRRRFPKAMSEDWFWAHEQGGQPLEDWVRYVTSQSNHWTLDAVPTLQSWTKPALVVWAGEDLHLPISWGARLARDIPGAPDEPKILPFAAHFWQAEVPESGARVFLEFFDALPASS